MNITFDHDLDELEALLEAARSRPYRDRVKALDAAANRVADEASRIARSYPSATGELADAVDITGTPASRIIGANVRQAFFLEYGSPNTGAPRAWLSGPARAEVNQLLLDLAAAAEPW